MENEITSMVKVGFGIIIGFISSLIGGLDELFTMLIIMIVIDLISGIMKGIVNKNINGEKFYKGGFKKLSIFLVVVVGTQIEIYLGSGIPLRSISITYYIISEGISFIENISYFVDLPEPFIKYFKDENVNNEGDDKDE